MVTVHLPTALIRLYPGAPRHVRLDARDIVEVMDRLDERWPGMRAYLCGAGPSIRAHINVFVDGEKSPISTPVHSDAEIHIMTAVSGG
jgi:molybdopterin converting factor small subunit